MKLHKFLMAALIALGTTIAVSGCGDDEKAAPAAPAASADAQIKLVADTLMDIAVKEGHMSNVKFAKIDKVTDTYYVVCYSAKLKDKGDKPFGVHVKKEGDSWKVVETEDHWEPKDRHK